jgi:hypothetical protein
VQYSLDAYSIIALNMMHSVGKHKADPMGANFFSEITSPVGNSVMDDLVTNNHLYKVGASENTLLTRYQDTVSEAAERSIVP